MATWFDWRTTCSSTDMPTPASTAYCSGINIVRTKVTTSTASWTGPVRPTDSRSDGVIVR